MTKLERELVQTLKDNKYFNSDVLEVCEEYSKDERIKLPLDKFRIRIELARYNLFKRVTPENEIKSKIESKVEEATIKKIEELEENPKIKVIKIIRKRKAGSYFLQCEDHKNKAKINEIYARVKKISLLKNINSCREEEDSILLLRYCPHCGLINYLTDNGNPSPQHL